MFQLVTILGSGIALGMIGAAAVLQLALHVERRHTRRRPVYYCPRCWAESSSPTSCAGCQLEAEQLAEVLYLGARRAARGDAA